MSNHFRFDQKEWQKSVDDALEKVGTLYMMQMGYLNRKSQKTYEDIRDAFLVGYKRGQENWLCNKFHWLEEEQQRLREENRDLDRRLHAMRMQMTKLSKAKEELLKLQSALKEGFTIRDATKEEDEQSNGSI